MRVVFVAMLMGGGAYFFFLAEASSENLVLSLEPFELSPDTLLVEMPGQRSVEMPDQLLEEYRKLKKCFIYGYEFADMSDIVGFHSEMETYQRSWSESLTLSGIETDYLKEHPKEAKAYYQSHCQKLSKPLNIKYGFDESKP